MNLNTLKRSEILKSEKSISSLFETGYSFTVQPIRLVFQINPSLETSNIKVGFAVPKKNFKRAVDRNLLKRRMREAFRTSKSIHFSPEILISPGIELMLIYQGKEMEDYQKIRESISGLLKKLSLKVAKK